MPILNKKSIITALVSIFLVVATNISLIYFKVPSFVYLNISGLFIFSMYFGYIRSVVLIIFIQIFMNKIGQSMEFLDYGFISNILSATTICTVSYLSTRVLYLEKLIKIINTSNLGNHKDYSLHLFDYVIIAFFSIIIMAVSTRFLSTLIYSNISEYSYVTEVKFDSRLIAKDFLTYGFSGIVSLVYLSVLTFFGGKNDSK